MNLNNMGNGRKLLDAVISRAKNVKQWTVHQRKMSQTVKKNSQKSNVDPKA